MFCAIKNVLIVASFQTNEEAVVASELCQVFWSRRQSQSVSEYCQQIKTAREDFILQYGHYFKELIKVSYFILLIHFYSYMTLKHIFSRFSNIEITDFDFSLLFFQRYLQKNPIFYASLMYLNHNDWTEVCLIFHKNLFWNHYERMKQKKWFVRSNIRDSFFLLDGVMITSSYLFFFSFVLVVNNVLFCQVLWSFSYMNFLGVRFFFVTLCIKL